MRWITAAVIFGLAANPAAAAEKEAGGDKAGAPGTNVDMPFLMAPMSGADGKLVRLCLYLQPPHRDLRRQRQSGARQDRLHPGRFCARREPDRSGGIRDDRGRGQRRRFRRGFWPMRGAWWGRARSHRSPSLQVQVAPLHPSPVTSAAVAPAGRFGPCRPRQDGGKALKSQEFNEFAASGELPERPCLWQSPRALEAVPGRAGHWDRLGRSGPTNAIHTRVTLMNSELLIILACGVLALLYGVWTIRSVLSLPRRQCPHAGNRRRHPGRRRAPISIANTPPSPWSAW